MYMHFWYAMHWHQRCAETLERCNFGELYLGYNISSVRCIFGVMYMYICTFGMLSNKNKRHLWWCLVGAITIGQCIFGALFLCLGCSIFLVLRLWYYGLSTTSRRLATAVAHLLYWLFPDQRFGTSEFVNCQCLGFPGQSIGKAVWIKCQTVHLCAA